MALPIVEITGNITADPELRYTQNGTAVASFTVAANRKSKDGNEETTFLRVSAWEALGENVASKLTKGTYVTVKGSLKQGGYEKDGQKITTYEVSAFTVSEPIPNFAPNGNQGGNQGNYTNAASSSPQGGNQGGFNGNDEPPF